MTYDTIHTLSGESIVLDMVVGNFYQVLKSAHHMDDFAFDLLVRAARHSETDAAIIASATLPHLTEAVDQADAVKLLEAFVLTLRNQEV